MPDADALPDALVGAPASARHLYTIVDGADEPLTYTDLQAWTGYSHGTISRYCRLLDRRGLVDLGRDPAEPRRKVVRPAD